MAEYEQDSDWKDGFLFLANDLALDFLNTRPVMDGEPVELLPDFDALVRWFVAAGQIKPRAANALRKQWGSTAEAAALPEAMRDLREGLRKAVLSWEAKAAIAASIIGELNHLMAQHPMRTRLTADATSTEVYLEAKHPDDLFAPIAHSAANLFATADRSRIRQCANCVLLFRDVSKKGMRHWCSMQLCGNRVKVSAYAARQRRSHQ